MTSINRLFILTSGTLLAVTGMAKLVSITGTQMILLQPDPLIGISFRHLLLSVGILELIIASLCLLFTRKVTVNLVLIGWLSTSFLIYRTGLWAINWQRPCHCLGNLTDAVHISPQTADTGIKVLLGYLLCGSYLSLLWLWKQKRSASATVISST
jgi:hypothetical protein